MISLILERLVVEMNGITDEMSESLIVHSYPLQKCVVLPRQVMMEWVTLESVLSVISPQLH